MGPALTFYFDRNFGRGLPESLALLDIKTVHPHMAKAKLGMSCRNRSEQLFPDTTPDDEWLTYVGAKGWVAVSHDQKFHKPGYEIELAAIKEYKVACFYLWGANEKRLEKARCFLRAYDNILRAIAATPRPFIYKIETTGSLTRIPV